MNQASRAMSTRQLADYYEHACLSEIEALKPGNVHIFADGHGMTVQDFVLSAQLSAAVIANKDYSLGQRIYYAVENTWMKVRCNTNLGIVLLCAPIIQTALKHEANHFRENLFEEIKNTDKVDAEWLFKAIRLAKPAGLGESKVHDVNLTPDCNLYQAMAASASRDLIGLQYKNGFEQLLTEGLPTFRHALKAWGNQVWALTATYLYWLSHYPDSHIKRKYQEAVATHVQREAQAHYEKLIALSNPKQYMAELLYFDQSLKARHINPGTSADLTVASMLLNAIL